MSHPRFLLSFAGIESLIYFSVQESCIFGKAAAPDLVRTKFDKTLWFCLWLAMVCRSP